MLVGARLASREASDHEARTLAWLAERFELPPPAGRVAEGELLRDHPLRLYAEHDEGRSEPFWIAQVHGLPRDLALRGDGSASEGQPRTGDPFLDRKFTLAALDGAVGRLAAPARHELERLRRVARRVRLEGGTLEVRATASELAELRTALQIVASHLGRGAPVAELQRRIDDDPTPTVRATMLWHLAHLDRARAVRTAARMAAHTPEEKLITGILLDDRPRLVQAITHPDSHLRLARRAARHFLKAGGDAATVFEALERVHGLPGLHTAALLTRGVEGAEVQIRSRLLAVVGQRADAPDEARDVLVTFAARLAASTVPHTDEALTALLVVPDPAVQKAALEALGSSGTVAVVPAIRDLVDQLSSFSSLRRVAQSTIERIQSRSQGAVGALTLAEHAEEAGALSEPDPRGRGELAMVTARTAGVD
jgi:hypothetical protein